MSSGPAGSRMAAEGLIIRPYSAVAYRGRWSRYAPPTRKIDLAERAASSCASRVRRTAEMAATPSPLDRLLPTGARRRSSARFHTPAAPPHKPPVLSSRRRGPSMTALLTRLCFAPLLRGPGGLTRLQAELTATYPAWPSPQALGRGSAFRLSSSVSLIGGDCRRVWCQS